MSTAMATRPRAAKASSPFREVYVLDHSHLIYGGMMAKTLIDIDEAALEDARRALRTRTKKDTVNGALAVVAALSARRRDLERFAADAHTDLRDVDIMSSAWQP